MWKYGRGLLQTDFLRGILKIVEHVHEKIEWDSGLDKQEVLGKNWDANKVRGIEMKPDGRIKDFFLRRSFSSY